MIPCHVLRRGMSYWCMKNEPELAPALSPETLKKLAALRAAARLWRKGYRPEEEAEEELELAMAEE